SGRLTHRRALTDLGLRLGRRGSSGLRWRLGFACRRGSVISTRHATPLGFGEDVGGRGRDGFLGRKLGLRVEGIIALPPGERSEDGLLALAPIAICVKQVPEQKEQRVR